MLNKNFILHLSLIEGISPITTKAIIEKKPDATISDLYLFSATDWMHYYGVKEVAAQKLAAGLADQKILETELQLIERYQINWVTILSDLYPALLRAIYMPPTVLYWKGGNFNAEQKHVAIVGSRAANAYGHTIVTTVVPELVS